MVRMRRSRSISYPAEAVESSFGSPVCERGVRERPEQDLRVSQFRSLAAWQASDGFCQVWPQAIPEHPGGTRSALDRFRETSIVDRRVRGDVPPHPVPSGERLLLIFPPMKPRLGRVVLVPAAPGRSCARQLAWSP